MKTSRSPRKQMRLFALSLALIGAFSFGTFQTVRTQDARTDAGIAAHSPLLMADGQETHGGGDGQESHGGGKHGKC